MVIVDTHPGAGGVIAADLVAKTAPGGYTRPMSRGSFAINPAVCFQPPYDLSCDVARQ